jgi:uncharacterized SAM-binding protein YcdF (DUF218 family)
VNVGLADRVLLTDTVLGPDVEDGIRPPSAELNRRVLAHRGVPEHKIVQLEVGSSSTADEAGALARYLSAHPGERVAVVTNALHTRRARWTFARRLGEKIDRVSYVSAPNPGFEAEDWWKSEAGLWAVTSEYTKLAYYWLRYGHGLVWCGGGVVTAIAIVVVGRRCRVRGWMLDAGSSLLDVDLALGS